MKILKHLIFLILSALITAKSTFKIQTKNSIVENNRQWSRVKVGVSGTKGSIKYYYDQYPTGWKQVRDYLYAPQTAIDSHKKYPCKIRVKDSTGQLQSATVVLTSDKKGLKVSDESFEYEKNFDVKFFDQNGFFGRPQMKKNIIALSEDKQIEESDIKRRVNPKDLPVIKGISTISEKPGSGLSSLSNFLQNIFTNKRSEFEKRFNFEGQNYQIRDNAEDVRNTYMNRIIGDNKAQANFDEANRYWRLRNPFENQKQSLFVKNDQTETDFMSKFSSSFGGNRMTSTPFKATDSTSSSVKTQQTSPAVSSSYTSISTKQVNQIQNQTKNFQNSTPSPTLVSQDANINQFAIINGIKESSGVQNGPIQSIDSIFLRLPSSEELDTIILSADGFAIIKTVQNTLQSNLTCQQKYSYLADFLGRIQSAIQMKSFAQSQLKVIIDSAKKEIERIDAEILKSEQMKSSFKIDDLKKSLENELIQLQKQYNEFNQVEIQIQPNYAKIQGYETDIQNLRNSSDQTRASIQSQKLKISQINSQIAALQRNLAQARTKKVDSESKIAKLENLLKQNQKKIDADLQQITALEKQIDSLEERSDSIKISYTTLEIKVDRLSQDIQKLVEKQSIIDQRIDVLQLKRSVEQEKLVVDELNRIKNMIEVLTERIVSIEQEVDRTYYECYNLSQISTTQARGALIYIVGNKDFFSYLRSSYGDVNIKNSVTANLEITPVDILSNDWQINYGSPFSNQELTLSDSFSFKQDFNCLNPASLITGQGVIRDIQSKSMVVELSDGSEGILNLGACTRLESVGGLPKIGQQILFKANKGINKNEFNVFRGSCI